MGDAYLVGIQPPSGAGPKTFISEDMSQMSALFITGKLLLEIASAGFGVTLGFAVKHWLDQRENARRAE